MVPTPLDGALAVLIGGLIIYVVFRSQLLQRQNQRVLRTADEVKPRKDLNSQTVFRLQGIPSLHQENTITTETVEDLVRKAFDIQPQAEIFVASLARNHNRESEMVATLSFSDVPRLVAKSDHGARDFHGHPVQIDRNGEETRPVILTLDIHFHGITPLHTPKDTAWSIDIIAIPGLNGHAFGSYKAKGGSFMWLRDDLPQFLPNARIWIYGYESKLVDSHSFQSLEDLGMKFCNVLRNSRPGIRSRLAPRAMVVIGHSLGGLVVKQALCQIFGTEDENDKAILRSMYGILFFGVPNQGMAIETLLPMVKDRPNESFLRSLGKDEPVLRQLAQRFSPILDFPELRVISFYETVESPTARMVNGKWSMSGHPARLVDISSATHGRSWETGQKSVYPVNRSHSDLVKFTGPHDTDYKEAVLTRLLEMSETSKTKPVLSKHSKDCLQSLSFPEQDFRPDQIHTATDYTCMWFLTHQTYTKWIEKPTGLLWVQGSPGVGKSTLMKFAVQNMEKEIQAAKSETLVLSYFFHGRGSELQKTNLGLLRSLLNQVLPHLPDTLLELATVFQERCTRMGTCGTAWKWGQNELQQHLKMCLLDTARLRPLVIFVDALDECGAPSAKGLKNFFDSLLVEATESSIRLKICFSCRYYPNLRPTVGTDEDTITVEKHNSDDISAVVRERLSKMTTEKRETLEGQILQRSRGVFQWVVIVCAKALELDEEGVPIGGLQDQIQKVPQDLHELYQNLLGDRNAYDRAQTIRLFHWVCFSERPLTVREFQHALAIDPNVEARSIKQYRSPTVFRKDLIDVVKAVKTLSRGLAEVELDPFQRSSWERWSPRPSGEENWEDQVVQLIHQSVLDFLLENWFHTFGPSEFLTPSGFGHFVLSRSCIRYLQVDEVIQLLRNDDKTSLSISTYDKGKFPMLHYSAHHLLSHLRLAELEKVDQSDLLRLFSRPADNPFLEDYGSLDRALNTKRHGDIPSCLLHFLASIGIKSALSVLTDGVRRICDLDHDVQAALQTKNRRKKASSEQDNTNAECCVGLDLRDKLGRTALHYAAINGQSDIAKLLLESGADPNPEDRGQSTPLAYAMGMNPIVKFKSEEGEDCRLSQISIFPSLDLTQPRMDIVVRLLALENVDPNRLYSGSKTGIIHHAIRNSSTGFVQTILESRNFRPNVPDEEGWTPLLIAVGTHRLDIMRKLLERDDLDVNLRGSAGETPLHRAVGKNKRIMVDLLLKRNGIEIDARDNDGETPLHLAVSENFEPVVDMLLATHRTDVNSRDKYNQTPLHTAVLYGRTQIIRKLLDLDNIDTGIRNDDGDTPFMLSLRHAKTHSTKIMLSSSKVSLDPHEIYGPPVIMATEMAIEQSWNGLIWETNIHIRLLKMLQILLGSDRIDPNMLDRQDSHPVIVALRGIVRCEDRYIQCQMAKSVFLILKDPRTSLCNDDCGGDVPRARRESADIIKYLLAKNLLSHTNEMEDLLSIHEDERWEYASIIIWDPDSESYIATAPSYLEQSGSDSRTDGDGLNDNSELADSDGLTKSPDSGTEED